MSSPAPSHSQKFDEITQQVTDWRCGPTLHDDDARRAAFMQRIDALSEEAPTVAIAFALGEYKGAVSFWPVTPRGGFAATELRASRAIWNHDLMLRIEQTSGLPKTSGLRG